MASVPTTSVEEAVAYIVLGTALYEPLLLAMRRRAHQSIFRQSEPPN